MTYSGSPKSLKPPNCLLCYFENSESSRPHYKGSLCYTPFLWSQGSNPSLLSPALAGGFFTNSVTWEAHIIYQVLPNCLLKALGNCPVFPNPGNVHTSKQNMLSNSQDLPFIWMDAFLIPEWTFNSFRKVQIRCHALDEFRMPFTGLA